MRCSPSCLAFAVELLRGFVAVFHTEAGRWRQYKSFSEERWWGKSGTDEFFYEGDPAWRTDANATGKFWRHVDSWRANMLQARSI